MKSAIASIIIIFIVSFSSDLLSSGAEKTVSGRLIYIHNDYIEIKKGKQEFILYWGEGSTVVKGETQLTRSDLYVCQVVRVNYTNNQGKMEIVKVNIVRDSNCLK